MPLPDGVTDRTVQTDRLATRYLEAGDPQGTPVVLVHGNLSTSRFFDDQLAACPRGMWFLAPDMRGFGGSEQITIDATRGLRDWSDDLLALLDALDVDEAVHLLGWSTGGGAIQQLAIDAPERVRSLTLVAPVGPFGFGGTTRDGTPATDDHAGTGGGVANADVVASLDAGDRSADSPTTIRSIMRQAYWAPHHTVPPRREDDLVDEVLRTLLGDGGYPGDSTTSRHWPGVAPGTTGILNALSPKYLDHTALLDLDDKPPVQWHRGTADIVIADGSAFDPAALGAQGVVPDWPGEEVAPVQPMVTQTRDLLTEYARRGGTFTEVVHDGAGHAPHIDHAQEFNETWFAFLQGS